MRHTVHGTEGSGQDLLEDGRNQPGKVTRKEPAGKRGQGGGFPIGKFAGTYIGTNLVGSCGSSATVSVVTGGDGTGCSTVFAASESPHVCPSRCSGLGTA